MELWRSNAAQLHLPMLIVVMRNETYCILKSFAVLEQTPGVPGLDIPGIDIVSLARGYGCDAARVEDIDAIKKAAIEAWKKQNRLCWRFLFPLKFRR
jgi:benzoylformate decarboxylase